MAKVREEELGGELEEGLVRLIVAARRVLSLGEILSGDLTTAVGSDAIRGLRGALDALGVGGRRGATP